MRARSAASILLALAFVFGVPSRTAAAVAIVTDSFDQAAGAGNFEHVASFYGLSARIVDRSLAPLSLPSLTLDGGTGSDVVFVHAQTLERLRQDEIDVLQRAVDDGAWLYVDAGFPPRGSEPNELPNLIRLTGGRVRGVRSFSSSIAAWSVRDVLEGFGGPFRGRTIRGVVDSQWDTGLVVQAEGGGATAKVLIEATDFAGRTLPIMVQCASGRGGVMVESGYHRRRAGPAPQGLPLRFLYVPRYFSSLVPQMLFLRFVFGESVWHSEAALANLTIDDPALVEKYGFLDVSRLLDEMRREGFHTTIATVPTKYRAAQPSVTALIRDNPRYYSIAVHGNNHDRGECRDEESVDDWEADFLEGLSRMDALQAESGLAFERVMIFPCGMPSAGVLPLVNRFNFIATVNAQDTPLGAETPADWDYGMHGIEWALDGAPSARRSLIHEDSDPQSLATKAAFDAFVGKPILFYAHHELFRSGPDAINEQVRGLRSYLPDLQWASLRSVLLRSYLLKREPNGAVSVLMAGNAIRLSNQGTTPLRYRVSKTDSGSTPISSVALNGRPVPYSLGEDRRLHFDVRLEAQEEAVLEVLHARGPVDLRLQMPRLSVFRQDQVVVPICNDGSETVPAIVAASPRGVRASAGRLPLLSDTVSVRPRSCAVLQLRLPPGSARGGTLRLEADPYDEIPELNESNNGWDLPRWWVH